MIDLNTRIALSGKRELLRGFSLIEVALAMTIVIVLTAMAVPTVMSIVKNVRTAGDARDLNGAIVMAKMRAASQFARARVYADLSANTFRVEWQRSGTITWTAEGGDQPLSNRVTFGYGSLSTPPAGTQTSLVQAPLCRDSSNTAIANTACVIFNSRGIPIDSSGTPFGNGALYVTDGRSVTGVTVSTTGLTAVWHSDASATNWIKR